MSDICFSTNEEEYHDTEGCIQDHCEEWLNAGDEFSYWVGEKKSYQHSSFIGDWDLTSLLERVQESAYEEALEWSDGYLSEKPTPEAEKEFAKLMSDFMDKHFKEPTFYTAINVREVKAVWDGINFKDLPL